MKLVVLDECVVEVDFVVVVWPSDHFETQVEADSELEDLLTVIELLVEI